LQTFPCYDLPLELREKVYKEAFKSRTIIDEERSLCTIDYPKFELTAYKWKTNVAKTSRCLVHKEFPRWTAVNRQFLTEAIQTFARGTIFEIKCRIDDEDEDEDEEIPVYKRFLLVRAIKSIKAPYIANWGAFSPNPALLQISPEDAKALSAFKSLRKDGTLPRYIVLECIYHVHPYASLGNPRLESPILEAWKGNFGKVTIITTLHEHRSGTMVKVSKQNFKADEDTLLLGPFTPLLIIRDRLRQNAELWARRLVRRSDCEQPEVQFGKEKEYFDLIGGRRYIQTVEVVDGKTRPAMPREVLWEVPQPKN
jgi:hypothetical protein